MPKSLPVLLYHSISPWTNSISVDPDVFESHLAAMTAAGWRGVTLAEAAAHIREGRELPGKTALITFDDGFLDNHVFAAPLLRKHGHHGVIFAVTGRIVDEEMPRPTLDDVWNGFVDMTDLPQVQNPVRKGADGLRVRRELFFSWKEARAMEASGSLRVEGHSHHHRSVFTGPDFKSVFRPDVRKRTFDRVESEVVFGLPRFDLGPALAHRAFLPSAEVYDLARQLTPQNRVDAAQFFADPANEARLVSRLKRIPRERRGRLEDDGEFRKRLSDELIACRDGLMNGLGRMPEALAWPWGRYCPEALEIARALGFTLFFSTTLGPNLPGATPLHVHRFKAKDKSPKWLLSRLRIYSKPLLARVYGKFHG